MTPDAELRDLNGAIRGFAQHLRPDADVAAQVELDHAISRAQDVGYAADAAAYANDAVQEHLPVILSGPTTPAIAPIFKALASCWHRIDWHYNYPERADFPGLKQRVAFGELVGPQAPLVAPDLRIGFTFMAPHVLYPSHAHPAYELYVVLAGRSLWTKSGIATWQDAGAVIVHDSEEPHTMQTESEPLLALYTWRGDIVTPPRYV